MKEVGDKFGAGELILPFVLQSAEVMKRAVAQLEKYLDKIEGYTKGTVVLATVFGDVHDIGKSLVNTILTNNGYTVVDLGKQVPIQTILDAAQEHDATAIGLSRAARLDLQADARVHPGAARQGPPLPGADRRRGDQPRVRLPRAVPRRQRLRGGLRAGRLLLQGRVRGPRGDGPADRRRRARRRSCRSCSRAPREFRAKGEAPVEELNFADDSVRSPARTDAPIPTPPFWGVREIPVDLDEVYRHLDTHVLFKLHWGGKGVKGEAWQSCCARTSARAWSACGTSRPTCTRARCSASSPATRWATTSSCSTREDRDDRADALRLPAPAEGRSHLPGRLLPPGRRRQAAAAELDVIAVQAVTVGSEVTELMAKLEAEGEFAEQLFVHGLGVQTAEGLAEWLHYEARAMLGIPAAQGRRYSWGYPAVPEQSEHLKVEKLLDLEQIGMTHHRRLRARARAVDARARRPPPAGDLLRHAPGPPAPGRLARRPDQGLHPRPLAVRRARRRGPAGRGSRSRGRARDGRLREPQTQRWRAPVPNGAEPAKAELAGPIPNAAASRMERDFPYDDRSWQIEPLSRSCRSTAAGSAGSSRRWCSPRSSARPKRPACELFDLIAGTSAGGHRRARSDSARDRTARLSSHASAEELADFYSHGRAGDLLRARCCARSRRSTA